MNKVILIGNLTRDPELSTVGAGVSLCKFGVAVNRSFTNSNGERETDFFNVVCWRGLADNCGKFLLKGSKVGICGSIQTRQFEVEGQKRTTFDIQADDVEFLSPKNHGGEGEEGGGGYRNERSYEGGEKASYQKREYSKRPPVNELKPVDDEELPF